MHPRTVSAQRAPVRDSRQPVTSPSNSSEAAADVEGVLGLGSGIGIVVASMVGAGVFLSAGFMAQNLTAGWILVAWIVGALLAMAGARTYAEVSILIPRSGGEYRYLSELIHPAVGYLAGWASLLVGFSAPMAISAYSAAAFANTVVQGGDARIGASVLIVAIAILHSVGYRTSTWAQNALVSLKGALVLAFVAMGMAGGQSAWPTWTPASGATGFAPAAFATSLFFVSYAFSGWNAAVYAAEEFKHPRRDVPAAMLIGCSLVGVAYLVVNWVLVANLTPERAQVVFDYEQARVTVGHLVAQDILGDTGSAVMSSGIALALVSSTSAMLLVGPRVYAEMARDGFLPAVLAGQRGAPPRGSVALQAVLAIALLHLHSVGELLSNVAGVLVVFSTLVAVGLLVRARRGSDAMPRPRPGALVAACIYIASSGWMLYNAFKAHTGLLPWLGVVAVAGLAAFAVTRGRAERTRAPD